MGLTTPSRPEAKLLEVVSGGATPTLLGMPKEVMFKILDNSRCMTMQVLRKVCRPLRDFIDEFEPAANLDRIEIDMDNGGCRARYVNHDDREMKIKYSSDHGNCSVSHQYGQRMLKNQDVLEILAHDFKLIAKHQKKPLREFSVIWSGTIDEQMKNVLESWRGILKAPTVRIANEGKKGVSEVLKIVDPESVHYLSIENMFMRHCKEGNDASNLKILDFVYCSDHFSDFFRSRFFDVGLRQFTLKDFKTLEENFCKSDVSEHLRLVFGTIQDMDKLAELLGTPFELDEYSDDVQTAKYQNGDLRIDMNYYYRQVVFTKEVQLVAKRMRLS